MCTSAPSAFRCSTFSRRHLVGHHEHHAVALGARDQRQAEAGVAGGGLDDRAAGLQAAVALGGLDHRQADAVLDRAAGVLRFELEEQLAAAGVEARHPTSGVLPIRSSTAGGEAWEEVDGMAALASAAS